LNDRTYLKIQRLGGSPLLSPVGLCLGEGDSIFVCDSESGSIHELSGLTGALRRTLRVAEDLDRPVALTYRVESGELYVVDVTAHSIKVLDRNGGLLRIIGGRGAGPGEFNYPCALAADAAGLWVVDTGNQRIQQLSWEGVPIAAFGRAGDAPGDLALPKGVALDSNGHVYAVDARFENVQVFDRSGRLLLAFGEEGTGPGAFWLPSGIHIDATDRIWICDSYNRRIQVFDYLRPEASESGGDGAGLED
jgi:sugar lactone lactonase YvrE